MLVVSVKILYGGHSEEAGMVAAHCHAGAYNNRCTIVVDDPPCRHTGFSGGSPQLR
jgi:4-hydroxy-3-polyprenylbenzoate decarboxylase